MKKVRELYERIITHFGAIMMLAIALIICLQIVVRRIGITVSWTEEIARYAFVVLCFMVWPVVILRGGDIVVSVVFDLFPKKFRRIALGVMHILMSFCLGLVLYSILRNIAVSGKVGLVSLRWLKLSYIYYFVVIGLISAIIANFTRAFEVITGRVEVLTDAEKSMAEIETTVEQVENEHGSIDVSRQEDNKEGVEKA
ncbi:MAG TPA: hypothetical protein DD738_00565 [Ruminiclostridium sp.]|nr:hypothetical protein [Ruminiclostridium sp.]